MADNEWKEFSAKTVEEAVKKACDELGVSEDNIDYEVVDKGKSNLLSILSKPAVIKAGLKNSENDIPSDVVNNVSTDDKAEININSENDNESSDSSSDNNDNGDIAVKAVDEKTYEEKADAFLKAVFEAMGLKVDISFSFDNDENVLSADLEGPEMGILIGKRGSTLDALQYLVNLIVNKNSEEYIKVKIDTENYRDRRKATLENLARNLSLKVRRSGKPVYLEPMNPYERRIIHFALQNDEYCETHSEGEEPYRKVVITLKPGVKPEYRKRGGRYGRGNRSYSGNRRNGDYRRRKNYNGNRNNNLSYDYNRPDSDDNLEDDHTVNGISGKTE